MIAYQENFARLVQVILPKGGAVVVMFEGYFDESGSFEEEPGTFCISGYFLTSDSACEMDKEWGRVLTEHDLPYFHMVDCAHGNGVFSGKTKDERSEIVIKLIALIKKYTLEGFSVIAHREHYDESAGDADVYSYCVDTCVTALRLFLKVGRIKDEIAYFFESGHKSKGRAYGHVAEKLSEFAASLTFAEKKKVKLLQAADLLAWQSAKYAKDQYTQSRPPRKDFMSLMEHHHSFYHINVTKRDKSVGIELWPLSKRAQATSKLSFENGGPITILREEGESIDWRKFLADRPSRDRELDEAFESGTYIQLLKKREYDRLGWIIKNWRAVT